MSFYVRVWTNDQGMFVVRNRPVGADWNSEHAVSRDGEVEWVPHSKGGVVEPLARPGEPGLHRLGRLLGWSD